MKQNIYVFIYLSGMTEAVPAGVFLYDDSEKTGEFKYGLRYEKREDALPVDPISLPLHTRALPTGLNGGIYGTLRDSIPDYWGRVVMAVKKDIAPEQLSLIDMMLESNAARIGNLDFRISADSPEPELSLPNYIKLEDIVAAAHSIENNEKVSQDILALYAQGSSMGGARPKCTVQMNDTMWLAKFPSKNDKANIPLIEYATMRLAAECGINTPEVRLEKIGAKDIFMVQRFDRIRTDKGWVRNGFMSALSLMKWDENDRHLWSYYTLADEMLRHMPVESVRQLYKRMLFNAFVNNSDDHPRNHGFLITGGDITISPAYDIVPSIKTKGVGTQSFLAMSVGKKGRSVDMENLLSYCYMFGYKSADHALDGCIKPMINIIRKWRDYFSDYGADSDTIRILEDTFFIPDL